jgi:hypothetical protein
MCGVKTIEKLGMDGLMVVQLSCPPPPFSLFLNYRCIDYVCWLLGLWLDDNG